MRNTEETFVPPTHWRYRSMTFDGANGGPR
jgi:hypothetical protein